MTDRSLGYIILACISLAVALFFGYVIWIFSISKEIRYCNISRISNLKIDDPVIVNGKTVGRIKNIHSNDGTVCVTMEMKEHINIYRDYKIFNTDKGILGDQSIVIETGIAKGPIVNIRDTLTAIFHPGISDVLGSAWKLKDLALMYRKKADLMLSGSEEKESFIAVFSAIIGEIKTFSQKLYNAALFLDAEVSIQIDTLYSFTNSAKDFIQEISAVIPEDIATVEKQIETVSMYIDKLDKIVTSLTDIVIKIKNNKLVQKDYVSKLLKQLHEIKDVINDIQNGAFKLRVKIRAGF